MGRGQMSTILRMMSCRMYCGERWECQCPIPSTGDVVCRGTAILRMVDVGMWVQEVVLRVVYPLGTCPEGVCAAEHDPAERDICAYPLGRGAEVVLRTHVP